VEDSDAPPHAPTRCLAAVVVARLLPIVSPSAAIALSILRSSSGAQGDDTITATDKRPTARSAFSELKVEAEQVVELTDWRTSSEDTAIA
jgi:hypothetical protein